MSTLRNVKQKTATEWSLTVCRTPWAVQDLSQRPLLAIGPVAPMDGLPDAPTRAYHLSFQSGRFVTLTHENISPVWPSRPIAWHTVQIDTLDSLPLTLRIGKASSWHVLGWASACQKNVHRPDNVYP